MRKITKSLLTLALLVLAVGGANARTSIDMSSATASTNATWTSATNTFAWTAENEYVVIPGLSGDLTGCYLDFTISDQCHLDIVYSDDSRTEGGWGGYGRFGSGGSKTQDLEFMAAANASKLNNVKEVRICSQTASGSMTVTSVSYYFPLKLNYDANGVATIPFKSIITSGVITFNPGTGVVTNTDGTNDGYLAIELPNGGIDLSTVKRIDVIYTGDDSNPWADSRVLQSLTISDQNHGDLNTWQGSRYGVDLTDYSQNATKVNTIKWNKGTLTNGTITISAIKFTSEFTSCAKAGETILKTLPWNKIDGSGTETPAWNMNGTSSSQSDTYYGNYSGDPTHYADLTEYDELRVYCANNSTGFRCFFINAEKTGVNQIYSSSATWNESEKYYGLKLSSVIKWDNKVALKAIKSEGGKEQNVTNIVVYKTPAAGSAQYLITGKGLLDASTTALLADANVTSIDATGMTNVTATTLTSANPNCLFIANSGKLSNTKNVIVSGTCANLELTDGKPFKAPADFTATTASYSTTINAGAGAGTLCLPFEATIPGGVTAYTLTYAGGDKATATPVETTIPANTPVLLNGSGAVEFTGSGAVDADASNVSGALTGVFAAATVPVNSYVLQKQSEKVGFFKVTGDKTINPFRAYLTASTSAPGLSIIFPEDNDVTGISEIEKMRNADNVTIFDLQGRKVAQPQKGLYIVNGKKVIFK